MAEVQKKKVLKNCVYHLLVCFGAFVMLYPLLWMIFSSFKPHEDVFAYGARILPVHWDFSNYSYGWSGFGGITFATFFKNSFVISILSTIGAVASSALTAYGFSRIRFRGRNLWFVCMMLSMMLPSQVTMIPRYILFNRAGWVDTFLPMVVPSFFANPFFVFLMIQFIGGLPKELDDSAYLDGCSRFGIFRFIIVPLIVPALATSTVFSFIWSWDDFMGPLLYLNKPLLYPVSMALRMYSDPTSLTNWGAMFAMSTLSLVPILLLFIFCQKYLVEGISTTGLKG